MEYIPYILGFIAFLIVMLGILGMLSRFYRKVGPEEALVRTGMGGMQVTVS